MRKKYTNASITKEPIATIKKVLKVFISYITNNVNIKFYKILINYISK
jgi:hypothetical protein